MNRSSKNIDEGNAYYSRGRYRDALNCYINGLKFDKKNVSLLTKKGNTQYQLGKKNEAYLSYLDAFINSGAIELIDEYVNKFYKDLRKEMARFNELLIYKYNIPITPEGLEMFLDRTWDELNDRNRLKEWNQFKKQLDEKYLSSPDEYVDLFLRHFGEQYMKHFFSLFCYLVRDRRFSLTTGKLAVIIYDRMRIIDLERFELLLENRRGRKQASPNRITGTQFVDYLVTYYESRGYLVKRPPHSHDFGADLILNKLGETIAVQAKCQKRPVGIKAVQEVEGARGYYRTQRALVVSTSDFTKPCVDLANSLGVELWDRKGLLDGINTPRF